MEKFTVRRWMCFVIAVLLLMSGMVLIIIDALYLIQDKQTCFGLKGIIFGIHLAVTGISGLIGYFPKKPSTQAPWFGPRSARFRSIFVFVIMSVFVTVLLISNSKDFGCVPEFYPRGFESSDFMKTMVIIEMIALHLAHLLCALNVGLACPDLLIKNRSSSSQYLSSECTKLLNNSNKNKKDKDCQPLRLPEARTHMQEVPGTNEKVTVVTLPRTDGIIYAVPEEQYAIHRGEATYLAPHGNTKLSAIFPTYTRLQTE